MKVTIKWNDTITVQKEKKYSQLHKKKMKI